MSSQEPVRLSEDGLGFQMSEYGILPLGTSLAPSQDYAPAVAPRVRQAEIVAIGGAAPPSPRITAPPAAAPSVATTRTGPREVVRSARARVKEIRVELRRMAALKRELDELERLLRAAKQKPTPQVRALRAG